MSNYLNLDELRQAVPKAVSDIVYMLTGAQGKARGSKSGRNRENKQFNLMYTSTGEIALEDHLRRGGIEMDAGLLLRFAHIPSDAGKGLTAYLSVSIMAIAPVMLATALMSYPLNTTDMQASNGLNI